MQKNCVEISWINRGALQALSTGFITEKSEPHKLASVWESITLVAQQLHVLANLFQLKFFTVCEQDVIFVQKLRVGTLADSELMPPSPLFR